MTTDPRHVAADVLAAMTDDEAAAFVSAARNPDPFRTFVRELFAPDADDTHDAGLRSALGLTNNKENPTS